MKLNKRLILSSGMLVFVAAVVAGGTGAFFSDTETSTGNVFTAGDIDLLVGNESYVTNNDGELVSSSDTTWEPGDLPNELFFDFADLKPGDIGEDTITLQVNTNDAWACFTPEITATPENDPTEPELAVDSTQGEQEGELQDELFFAVWADDGDNVYEDDERLLNLGDGTPFVTMQALADQGTLTLADSQYSIFTADNNGEPMTGETEYHIGKAWCYGEMAEAPVADDEDTDPVTRGATGFTCNGGPVGNESQTDGVEVSMTFYAEQSRNNDGFLCSGATISPEPVTLGSRSQSTGLEGYGGNTFDFTQTQSSGGNDYFGWNEVEITRTLDSNGDFVVDITAPRDLDQSPDNFDLVFDIDGDNTPDFLVHYFWDPTDPSKGPDTSSHWSYKTYPWGSNQALPSFITATPNATGDSFTIRIDSSQLTGSDVRTAMQMVVADEGFPASWTGEAAIITVPSTVTNIFGSTATNFMVDSI